MLARTLSLSLLCLAPTLACRMNPPLAEWVVIFTCDAGPSGEGAADEGPTRDEIERSLGCIGTVDVVQRLSFIPGPCFGPDPFFDPPDRPTLFFLRIDGDVDEVELRERLEGEPLVSEGRMEYVLARTRGR